MAKRHKDMEFHVDLPNGTKIEKTFDDAAALAVAASASRGEPVNIDVVIWSKAGARAYGGDAGVEQYEDDPEASVFERIVVRAESQGRVP